MAQGRFQVREVKGLTPGIEPTVSSEVFALGGTNYVFDSKGAKSPFGNRFLTPVADGNTAYVQGVRLRLRGGDRCFTFYPESIREWDESAGGWRIIYGTPDTSLAPYRWTFEYLNGYMYFGHPAVGLVVLNLATGFCAMHEEVGIASPTNVIAVSQSNGRLGVLTSTALTWSAPSNGLNFTPQLGQAGAQTVSERVPGDNLMLSSYARGFLTWTTGGVMRSEFSGDGMVFRHRTLNTEYRPINPFCVARVDVDTVVILDERGLFKSQGEAIQPYSPLFNEFLIDFLQERDYNQGQAVRLEWDDLQRRLYLSYSDSYADPIYEKAFVYYPPLDKWGEFNEPHYGILPFRIDTSERADDYFGFVDATKRARYWLPVGSRELGVEDATAPPVANLYRPTIQRPVQTPFGADYRVAPAVGRLRAFDDSAVTGPEDYYVNGAGSPATDELTGLGALIRFGLFRLSAEAAADELAEIHSLVVRSVKSGDSDVLSEDFNLTPSDENEDYNTGPGSESEDYGVSPINYINHTLELIGTIDGDTDYVRVTPELVNRDRAARFYACTVPGIWHIAEVGAESIGEAFHIKTFEFTGSQGGRLL